MTAQSVRPALRSQRLNLATHTPHEHLDQAVKAYAPFATLHNYSRFVIAQYLFQKELMALYNDPALIRKFPDLPERCRAQQALADLADLQVQVPQPVAGALVSYSEAQALGWLFVSEGSKLGAAFLIKRAVALNLSDNFGARHLGEPAGGRTEGWKRFICILDSLALSDEQEQHIEQAAVAAFERFNVLLDHAYANEPASQRVAS